MRAILKLCAIAIWLPLMMLLTALPWAVRWEKGRRLLTRWTFRGVNRIMNIHVQLEGQLSDKRPLMLVSNHCSYVDILVLGAALPIAFTPKSEIRYWPLIGFCCRLAGCVFIERTPRAIQRSREEIAARLAQGRVMCVFAEGTTGNGTELKPFKSSLFSLAEANDLYIQLAALCYTHRDDERLGPEGRAEIAWYDDMSLLPHLWRLLQFRRIDAQVRLLPLLQWQQGDDRKRLAQASQLRITEALQESYDHALS